MKEITTAKDSKTGYVYKSQSDLAVQSIIESLEKIGSMRIVESIDSSLAYEEIKDNAPREANAYERGSSRYIGRRIYAIPVQYFLIL